MARTSSLLTLCHTNQTFYGHLPISASYPDLKVASTEKYDLPPLASLVLDHTAERPSPFADKDSVMDVGIPSPLLKPFPSSVTSHLAGTTPYSSSVEASRSGHPAQVRVETANYEAFFLPPRVAGEKERDLERRPVDPPGTQLLKTVFCWQRSYAANRPKAMARARYLGRRLSPQKMHQSISAHASNRQV